MYIRSTNGSISVLVVSSESSSDVGDYLAYPYHDFELPEYRFQLELVSPPARMIDGYEDYEFMDIYYESTLAAHPQF